MNFSEYIHLLSNIAVLKEVAVEYSGKTIDNIIQQMESVAKEAGKNIDLMDCKAYE